MVPAAQNATLTVREPEQLSLLAEDPVPAGRPLVVAYGMGVDSTAVLIGLHTRGIRPDLILFADTGGEKPETYAYLPVISAWLASVGFPGVTIVRYSPVRASYTTLEEKCLANETLPSLAFGGKSCSLVFKREPQDKFCRTWEPALRAWRAGRKVVKVIGYDAGPADSRRSKISDDKDYSYWYPLRRWGWDREQCERRIVAAGLPVPPKSACWFCPASKKHEVDWLARAHPDLLARALEMEDRARSGKHGLGTTKGLGRTWSWRAHAETTGLVRRRADGRIGLPIVEIRDALDRGERADTAADNGCWGM